MVEKKSRVEEAAAVPSQALSAAAAESAAKKKKHRLRNEDQVSVIGKYLFLWFFPVIKFGYSHVLTIQDLAALPKEDDPKSLYDKFMVEWNKEVRQAKTKAKDGKPRMVRLMLGIVGVGSMATASLLYAVFATCSTVVPLISKRVLELLGTEQFIEAQLALEGTPAGSFDEELEEIRREKALLASGLIFLPFIGAYCQAIVTYISRRGSMHLFEVFVQAVFNKSLKLSSASRNTASSGQLVNLIATDAGTSLERSILLVYPLFLAPIIIAVVLYLIYNELGKSMGIGFAVMVVAMPLNLKIFMMLTKFYGETVGLADSRIRLVNEALQAVRIIKMYAWENPFIEKIRGLREKELGALRKHAYTFSVGLNAVFLQLPYLIQFFTFSAYYAFDMPFNAAIIFTAIQLFQLLQQQLTQLPNAVSQLSQSMVAARRLRDFLLLEELHENKSELPDGKLPDPGTIVMEKASYTWDVEDHNSLKNISLDIQPGNRIAVLGMVASGKSSLLLSIIGELRRSEGNSYSSGTVAYASQSPFVLSMTLRENILFGKPYDAKWYAKVIDACSLKMDIESMPGGDSTAIGERGINLSGGQRSRVALARAVYAQADILLLDDPLSAVDAHVGAAILSKLVFGDILKGKTVIMTTNKLERLNEFDSCILLDNGEIKSQGTWGVDVVLNAEALAAVTDSNEAEETAEETRPESTLSTSEMNARPASSMARPESTLSARNAESEIEANEKDELYGQEQEAVGTLKLSVLTYYIRNMGLWTFIPGYILYVFYLFTPLFSQLILSYWTDDVGEEAKCILTGADNCSQFRESNDYWYKWYLGVVVGGFFVCVTAAVFIAQTRINGSRNLHNNLLKSTFNASITDYFDVHPLGQILNRFAKDISTVDHPLSQMIMFAVVVTGLALAAIVGIVIGTDPTFLLVIVPIVFFYGMLYRYMRITAIQLQRLESVSRSPIYSHFSETLNGLKTIRGFREQESFIQHNADMLTGNMVAYFLARVILPSSLQVLVNLLGMLIMSAVTCFLFLGSVSAGQAGLALTYALSISNTLNAITMIYTEVEVSMNSVERIKLFSDEVLPEDPMDDNAAQKKRRAKLRETVKKSGNQQLVVVEEPSIKNLDPDWPAHGHVEFSNVVAGYRDGPDVIHGISLSIQPGERIGVCGRTGSAKSTMLNTLLRVIELRQGTIVVDGINIANISLRELRKRLAIIPQSPVVFQSSLRFNLDPFNECTDEELNETLRAVQLTQFVGELDHELVEGGENVSEGQRQLICVARALLRKSRLLMLDEASAMLDKETDRLLQNLVREMFTDRTVITIAHRLNTIIDSTRILVMDSGNVAEFDSPDNLLADSNSIFSSMVASENAASAN